MAEGMAGKQDPISMLRDRFRATTASTIATFRQLARELASNPAAPDVIEALRRELHRVRGTAGSYGYHAASTLATKVEERVEPWASDPTAELDLRSVIVSHFSRMLELYFEDHTLLPAAPPLPGGSAPAERAAEPRHTLLVVGAAPPLLEQLKDEAKVRGFRLATLTEGQCSMDLVRDINPQVLAGPIGAYAALARVSAATGIPCIILERREANERASSISDMAPTAVIADVSDGVAVAFDRAENVVHRTTWTGATVLAVDDDPAILAIVEVILTGPDVRVLTLDDPGSLMERLAATSPSLLLIDVQMAEHSGLQLTRTLRADARWRDLPVIILSSNSDAATRAESHYSGADEFISKPIVAAELKARVAAGLERRRQQRLAEGIHPGTGVMLPTRTLAAAAEAFNDLRARSAGKGSLVVIRPTRTASGVSEPGPWLRETIRLATGFSHRSRVFGYHDGTDLLLLGEMSGEAIAEELTVFADGAPQEAPRWRAGVADVGDLPSGDFADARRAAEEAADVALSAERELVHRWQPNEAQAAPDVVVVEDDPSLSEMLQYALRATGFTFRSFSNGRVALDHLLAMKTHGRRPFVLLDVDLPGMDGYSVHERLRVERPGDFAIVYVTLHTAESDQLRALKSGAMDYITKPVNLRLLMAKMSSWARASENRP